MTVGIGINSQVTSTCDLYVQSTGLDEYQSILVRYQYEFSTILVWSLVKLHIIPVSNRHDARPQSGTREIVLGYLLGNLVRATYVKVLFK